MADFEGKALWLVQKVWWRIDEECSTHERLLCADAEWGEPVAVFVSRKAAEAEADRLSAEARDDANPFALETELEERTSMPEGVFRDWLTDAGLEPPEVGEDADWAAWWRDEARRWTAEQRDKVWQALDYLHFFIVVKLPPPEKE
jgi:hypothetical protein